MQTVTRWNQLINLYGSSQEALARVVSAHDELERLKAAVRRLGITPEAIDESESSATPACPCA